MKAKKKTVVYPAPRAGASVHRDAVALPGVGLTFPVRVAKAKLSALLELVAAGQDVTITSDGEPKAVLVSMRKRQARKVFTGTTDLLEQMPVQTVGPFAEEIIRTDRDGRGW